MSGYKKSVKGGLRPCVAQTYSYFCLMLSDRNLFVVFWLMVLLTVPSCDSFFKEEFEQVPLARVGNAYLYKNEVELAIPTVMSSADSAAFITDYINRWASKELLLTRSKINLPDETLNEFDRLVADYRAELYTRAYVDELTRQMNDSAVTTKELLKFYNAQKENFKLNEKIYQLRFIGLPPTFLNPDLVEDRMKRFEQEDARYLDSISVHFKKAHFNDSIWVSASQLMMEIPPLNYKNQDSYLKKSKFFEIKDSTGVYFGRVMASMDVNDQAPFTYVIPDLKEIILNRRRLDYVRQIEADILSEATKKNEFENYQEKQE